MTFKPQRRLEVLEAPAEVAPYETGSEPLRISVRVSLSQAEWRRLGSKARSYSDVLDMYAPLIVSWNLGVAPPAESGAGQFLELPDSALVWLITEVAALTGREAKRRTAEVKHATETIKRMTRSRFDRRGDGDTRPAC